MASTALAESSAEGSPSPDRPGEPGARSSGVPRSPGPGLATASGKVILGRISRPCGRNQLPPGSTPRWCPDPRGFPPPGPDRPRPSRAPPRCRRASTGGRRGRWRRREAMASRSSGASASHLLRQVVEGPCSGALPGLLSDDAVLHGDDRLDGEHRPEQRPCAPDPSSSLEVVEGVDDADHPSPGHFLPGQGDELVQWEAEAGGVGGGQRQEPLAEGERPGVDDGHGHIGEGLAGGQRRLVAWRRRRTRG